MILQTHMDMVCEKNSDKVFDFDNDAIEPVVVDGWVKTNGTTLSCRLRNWNCCLTRCINVREIKPEPIRCLITVDGKPD
ncbi:MAG: hypothetical protein R2757_12290 [Draconibacterium sp.]